METSKPPSAEPEPNWNAASYELGWLLPFHFISFGCTFFGLALFSLFCLCRIVHTSRRALKRYFITVCILLFFFALTRSAYLLLDPYGSKAMIDLPAVVEALLSGAAYPFITSTFTLVFLSLLEATKLKPFPRKIQNVRVIVPIIVIHFALVGIADIFWAMCPNAMTAAVLCRAVFILWGASLFAGYLYAGLTVFKKRLNKQDALLLQSPSCSCQKKKKLRSRKMVIKVAKFTGAAAFLGLGLCIVQTYSLVRIYKSPMFTATEHNPIEIWAWLGTVTCSRLIELAMGCLMCSVIYLPSSPPDSKQLSLKANKSSTRSKPMTSGWEIVNSDRRKRNRAVSC